MFADRHFPPDLPPEELDKYLAMGWYRMGQSIFTTHFLNFEGGFYPAIWIRLALQGFQFSKSNRKLLRKLDLFRVELGPVDINEEKEALFKIYRKHFEGSIASSLDQLMNDDLNYNIYETWETRIYDEDQLVAFSFFDLGKAGAASITGVYHPDYKKNSLGFCTMLLEIDYCLKNDFHYYYPGYVVPGYPRFDYKLRIGKVEYFNLQENFWMPYEALEQEHFPTMIMENKLKEVQGLLKQLKIPNNFVKYPHFSASLYSLLLEPYLNYPFFIHCFPSISSVVIAVIYDIEDRLYKLLKCSLTAEMTIPPSEEHQRMLKENPYYKYIFSVEEILTVDVSPFEVVSFLVKIGSLKLR